MLRKFLTYGNLLMCTVWHHHLPFESRLFYDGYFVSSGLPVIVDGFA